MSIKSIVAVVGALIFAAAGYVLVVIFWSYSSG